MRGVLLLLLSCAVACEDEDAFDPQIPIGASVGPSGGPVLCRYDDACPSGSVCARNDTCYPTSQVRSASVSWTLNGAPTDATSCGPAPNLEITFYATVNQGPGSDGQVSFAPVPCVEGKFSIDKLPMALDGVILGNRDVGSREGKLDDGGLLTLDLPF